MNNVHNLRILPNQQAINSVAALSQELNSDAFNLSAFLIKLKETIIKSKFMSGQDNAIWMSTRGHDFMANPKLFACAPLTCICAFLGEIFHKFDTKEIQEQIPYTVIESALVRLNDFS